MKLKRLFCNIFGHKVNETSIHLWCSRCSLAYEEIYNGLQYYTDMKEVFCNEETETIEEPKQLERDPWGKIIIKQ